VSGKPRARRQDKPKPPLWKRVAALCETVIIASLIVAYLYSDLGPPRAFRQGAFAVFRHELTQLPPYPNSVVNDETDYNGPLHPPVLDRSYTLDGTCLDVHIYYAQLAVAKGWATRESATSHNRVIYSEFRKTLGEYTLRLVIECEINPTTSPGYSLGLDTA